MTRQAFTIVDETEGPFYHGPRQLFPLIGEGLFTVSFEIAKRDASEPSPTVSLGVLYYTNGVQGSFVPFVLDSAEIDSTEIEKYSADIVFGTGANEVPETATDVVLMARYSTNNLDVYSSFGPLSPTARGVIVRSDQINAAAREVISIKVDQQEVSLAQAQADITAVSIAGANLNSAFTDYTNTANSRFDNVEASVSQNTQTISTATTALAEDITQLEVAIDGDPDDPNDNGITGSLIQVSSATASQGSFLAQFAVGITDPNGRVTGFGLYNETTGEISTTVFNVAVDALRHIDPNRNTLLFESDANGFRVGDRLIIGQTNDARNVVIDNGMGSDADLVFWVGPEGSAANPTRANAVIYLASDGSASFGQGSTGIVVDDNGGVLINGQDPLAGANGVALGAGATNSPSKTISFTQEVRSNGNTMTIIGQYSWNLSKQESYSGSTNNFDMTSLGVTIRTEIRQFINGAWSSTFNDLGTSTIRGTKIVSDESEVDLTFTDENVSGGFSASFGAQSGRTKAEIRMSITSHGSTTSGGTVNQSLSFLSQEQAA